ncbi:proline iminopeptidase [Kribbella kalugense]|uniref:prolyl aminopeptidase n=1 Tax=Kribbella kalugense TaxID=2512221 RepID=A0A4R7ZU98_9ACTN|nr:proline iminopeptidase [Kribbella kalugense]
MFDLERYRIILFDQRGCGRSTPHASDLATDISLNTTEHLLRDMEQLRAQLGVERWLSFGGSWGSALSVACAERHPERVSEMLPAFWLMGRAEVDWSAWEDAVLSLEPHGKPAPFSDRASDDLLAFARICAHYAANNGWLEDGALLRNAGRLAGIPAVIMHGRLDLSCPYDAAWQFAQAWPNAELVAFDDAGHKGSPAMHDHVRSTVARFSVL